MRGSQATATVMDLSLMLVFTGAAFAASSDTSGSLGTTSGPAAGSNVQPGTNQKMAHNGKKTNAVGGAPGVAGPKGSKNGPAVK